MTLLEEVSGRTNGVVDSRHWHSVCRYDDLQVDRGVCALIGDSQVALFLVNTAGPGSEPALVLFALNNLDPVSRASVMARGIVGSVKGEVVVASPMYKQRYSLRTGVCVDDPTLCVSVFAARVADGSVEVALPSDKRSD